MTCKMRRYSLVLESSKMKVKIGLEGEQGAVSYKGAAVFLVFHTRWQDTY
jgi:hypothetical protein